VIGRIRSIGTVLNGAHSSSGLGHRPLKAETTGSNPVCATNIPACRTCMNPGFCARCEQAAQIIGALKRGLLVRERGVPRFEGRNLMWLQMDAETGSLRICAVYNGNDFVARQEGACGSLSV